MRLPRCFSETWRERSLVGEAHTRGKEAVGGGQGGAGAGMGWGLTGLGRESGGADFWSLALGEISAEVEDFVQESS